MRSAPFVIMIIIRACVIEAQITCSANLNSGSAYPVIENAGFGIETPDCRHTDFGSHITQVYDSILNKNVFVFHSHIIEDDDRCINDDRVRMEIKGGSTSPGELQHVENSSSYYRWKFKIDKDFRGSSSFCHIFQNKAFGGEDSGMPLITITPRTGTLQIIHNGGETGNSLGILKEVPLAPFKGKWIEGYIKQVHSEAGAIEITLKDLETGSTLLSYSNNNLDLWRSSSEFNRPKWGIYRSRVAGLKDEEVRFADFCISENSQDLCPEDSLNGITGWFSARPELKQHNDSTFIMSFTQPLTASQITEDNFLIEGSAGAGNKPFTAALYDDYSVAITFTEMGVLPVFSTIIVRAENLTSQSGKELKGNLASIFTEPDKRPTVSGIEITVDNETGFVVASSSKPGFVYLIKYGEYPGYKTELDSLVGINLGRSAEAVQPDVSVPLYTNGLSGGFYNYYAVDQQKRVSLPGTQWVKVEETEPVSGSGSALYLEPFRAFQLNDQIHVDPGETDDLYSLEIYGVSGLLLYQGENLIGKQYISLDVNPGILIIRRISHKYIDTQMLIFY